MAKSESTQKKLSRVRAPRVHITYDVETGGAIEKRELPFVVGVFADLSGQPSSPLPKIKDRKFVEIDNDNFDKVLERQAPRLVFRADNTLKKDKSKLGLELKFKSLEDFEPKNVVKQVEPLNDLLELRNKLSNLRSSLYGNEKLEEALQDAVKKTEAVRSAHPTSASPDPAKES